MFGAILKKSERRYVRLTGSTVREVAVRAAWWVAHVHVEVGRQKIFARRHRERQTTGRRRLAKHDIGHTCRGPHTQILEKATLLKSTLAFLAKTRNTK